MRRGGPSDGYFCFSRVPPSLTPTRHRIPSPESFREGVKQAEEDIKDALLPPDIEEAQNAKFTKTWKALRIASRDRFHLFNKFDDKFDEDRNDLEMLFDVDEKAKEEARPKVNQQKPLDKNQEGVAVANKVNLAETDKSTAST